MRLTGLIRIAAVMFSLGTTWLFVQTYVNTGWKVISLRSWLGSSPDLPKTQPPRNKCGNQNSCPENSFAFKVMSGAANVVGPSMCFENTIIMSGVKSNVGRGLNIALVNGTNGQLMKTEVFDMYSGDINLLLDFLKAIQSGTIVIVASYDDPATKLNDEARTLLTNLGSSHASKLAFRDNWTFVGAKGLKDKSPYEQHLKNEAAKNKYDGWPEVLEMEGCLPKKMD
ncbi:protein FAM3D [Chelonia mydas]|uniref:protein FAM3D n=1 Tax=Chelonia mydas TaxID=8469 RepID=UPI0018A1F78B|nr:protein FAM3D [Chelonia mydas]XP_037761702.1 protein FAM3D [Chelonia mydas]XP_043406691.1 protein FAM3D [Chelonia mydas]XP_043406692.1 protein FAM3D [Chelonia mydas]